MTDHAKVLERYSAMGKTSDLRAACRAGADAIEECERLRAENARLREMGNAMAAALICYRDVDEHTGKCPARDKCCDACTAARRWDEEVGK